MTQILQTTEYDTYAATRGHFHCNGLAMLPTAAPFPYPASVVALHGGIDYDIIIYTATRRGAPPVIPDPRSTNNNRVFLRGWRIAEFPIQDFSGTYGYGVTGGLLFGILSPEGLASTFYIGNLPFPGVDKNQSIPSDFFQYQLVNQNMTQALVPVPPLPSNLQNMIRQG